MMNNEPKCVRDDNLSFAWGKALLHALQPHCGSLLVQVNCTPNGTIVEDSAIHDHLNSLLRKYEIPTIEQTSLTIVPYERWLRLARAPLEQI